MRERRNGEREEKCDGEEREGEEVGDDSDDDEWEDEDDEVFEEDFEQKQVEEEREGGRGNGREREWRREREEVKCAEIISEANVAPPSLSYTHALSL